MSKKQTKVVAPVANVAKPTKDKATKPTAIVASAPPVPRKTREGVAAIIANGGDAAKLRIVAQPRMVVGGSGEEGRSAAAFALLQSARTVGEYRAAREKAGLGNTVGGYLPGWIEKGFVAFGDAPKKATKQKVKA